ncbi:MAG: hypothetical protein LCH38_03250 [Proteobacteria bacterium]|nr:hypothetical protein [Pseudomonadota bacterium]
MRRFLLVIVLAIPACAVWAQHAPTPSVEIAGPARVILGLNEKACGAEDYPDAPARAFRDAKGQVHLIASHTIGRQWIGPSLLDLSRSCAVMFRGGRRDDPEVFDDHAWLAAFYTEDGKRVHALVHNEYHGSDRPARCHSRRLEPCWENAVTYARSEDGGMTFFRPPGIRQPVAALPYAYQGDRKSQFGYFNPTNIVKWNSHYYVIIPMIDVARGRSGLCLARTEDLGRPESWRGWDGSDFTIILQPDMRASDPARAVRSCVSLDMQNLFFGIGSISYHPERQLFFAVMRFNRWDRKRNDEVPGIYVSVSRDLISWEKPKLLLSDEAANEGGNDPLQIEYYPALLDPQSTSRSFDTISDKAMLFTIQMSRSRPASVRAFVARPVELQ